MPAIALVTAREARTLDEDLPPLASALSTAGYSVDMPIWDDASIDWSRYRCAILRSTWDYTQRIDQFLRWCDRVAKLTTLLNPPALVRWNLDKRYLHELQRAGVDIIPTQFAAPGTDLALPAADGWVVKPSVGAGSRGARRFLASDRAAALAHAAQLQAAGFTAMAQPYLASVDVAGETALIYFAGEFSHAIRKGPLLRLEHQEIAGLFAKEDISARTPGSDELNLGAKAIAAIPGGAPLYARVDMIRDDDHRPRILELELAEPSLFFAYGPGSAQRLAAIVDQRLR